MTVRRRAALLTFALAAAFALAAGSASAAGLPSLIAMAGRGGIGTVVPGLPGTERAVADPGSSPAWSPNGEVLAYADYNEIILLDRGMHRIAVFPVSVGLDLTWAPDGRRLAYRCLDGPLYTPPPTPGLFAPEVSGNNICVIDVVTGAHHVLAASDSAFFIVRNIGGHLSWSPRGDEIVLSVERPVPGCSFKLGSAVVQCVKQDIAAVNTANGAWSPVTTGPDQAYSPAFSPNGHKLAYVTARGVVVAAASGANPHTIGAFQGSVATLAWSPNGKELVISSNRKPANNGNYDLFELSVHGGRLKQLTNTPGDETSPSWAQALTLCTVPKLKGQTLAAGKRLIQLAGCRLGVVGGPTSRRATRKIVTQSPGASQNVRLGTKVNVKLR